MIFTGTIGAYYISRFHRCGQGAFWKPSSENVHGVKVDGFISGVFGYEIPVVVKKEWANYPSGARVQRQPVRGGHVERASASRCATATRSS